MKSINMAFSKNYINEMNEILMKKRDENDVSVTLSIPEHKFKKVSEKFNYALHTIYKKYVDNEVKMFHILLSMQEYFEIDKLVNEILDDKNTKIVKKELADEYHVKSSRKGRKNGTKKGNK